MTDATQTGVGVVICYAHADKISGALHGHSCEAVIWFDGGHDAKKLQEHCVRLFADLDHAVLPDELAWAEDLAAEIKHRSNAVEVEIRRPLERLYARAR